MAYILGSRQRISPKPEPWNIDGDSVVPEARRFWEGLVLCVPFWEGSGLVAENIAPPGRPFPAKFDHTLDESEWTRTAGHGFGVDIRTDRGLTGEEYDALQGPEALTLIAQAGDTWGDTGGSWGRFVGIGNGTDTSDNWALGLTAGEVPFFRTIVGESTHSLQGTTGLRLETVPHHVAATWGYADGVFNQKFKRIYLDGVEENSSVLDVTALDSDTDQWHIGAHHGSPTVRWVGADIHFIGVWTRTLDVWELNDHVRDPYLMLQPARPGRRFFVPVAGGIAATAGIAVYDATALDALPSPIAEIVTADYTALDTEPFALASISTVDYTALDIEPFAIAGIATYDATALDALPSPIAELVTADYIALDALPSPIAELVTADYTAYDATAATAGGVAATAGIAVYDATALDALPSPIAELVTADYTAYDATAATSLVATAGIAVYDATALDALPSPIASLATAEYTALDALPSPIATIATYDTTALDIEPFANARIAEVTYTALDAAPFAIAGIATYEATALDALPSPIAGISVAHYTALDASTGAKATAGIALFVYAVLDGVPSGGIQPTDGVQLRFFSKDKQREFHSLEHGRTFNA